MRKHIVVIVRIQFNILRERAFLFYLVRFQFKVRVISIIGIRRCFFLLQLKLKSQSRTKHIAIWSVTLSVMKVHHGIETFRVLDSVHTCTLCAEHFMHFLQCHKSTLWRNVITSFECFGYFCDFCSRCISDVHCALLFVAYVATVLFFFFKHLLTSKFCIDKDNAITNTHLFAL